MGSLSSYNQKFHRIFKQPNDSNEGAPREHGILVRILFAVEISMDEITQTREPYARLGKKDIYTSSWLSRAFEGTNLASLTGTLATKTTTRDRNE